MTQTPIPFWFLRGGTSRGPYFRREDLPEDRDQLAKVLCQVVGAGNPRNIDGLGGGVAVTTKTAMLSRSAEPGIDVDYFFAQVAVEEALVDYGPTCGNILVGVGPAAIEMGLVEAQDGVTPVRIRAVNTGATVEALVQTPGGQVEYRGDVALDGVPGTAAPVGLNFLDVVGSFAHQKRGLRHRADGSCRRSSSFSPFSCPDLGEVGSGRRTQPQVRHGLVVPQDMELPLDASVVGSARTTLPISLVGRSRIPHSLLEVQQRIGQTDQSVEAR